MKVVSVGCLFVLKGCILLFRYYGRRPAFLDVCLPPALSAPLPQPLSLFGLFGLSGLSPLPFLPSAPLPTQTQSHSGAGGRRRRRGGPGRRPDKASPSRLGFLFPFFILSLPKTAIWSRLSVGQ